MARYIVADDKDDERNEVVLAIKDAVPGAYVDEACDGRELVEKVRSGKYDLVFTDGNMPNMNGFVAIGEIRGFNQDLPICMLSGNLSVGTKRAAERIGATCCIDKGAHDVFDKISELVRKYASG